MGFIHAVRMKGDFMKNFKFKKVYLLELGIAVIISLGIGSIIGMKVFYHLYNLSEIHAYSFVKTHKRIDLLENHIKEHCPKDKAVTPVSL